ncbi:MAG: dethiobiotin synthase [Xanthomonadales bacterium]|nr:dethiobiotin synthase [Xanthomonadales bacterium]
MSRGVFIAGTDTGIGKTFTSVALMHALRAHGLRVAGMKPVASGCIETTEGLRNDDALALQRACSPPTPAYDAINPLAFRAAVSPHLAAHADGITPSLAPIKRAYAVLADAADIVVVEGVGGWLAPISDELTAAAIVKELDLPVILVVGLRLGCLNHAQLSARAIQADGARLFGWIGNRVDPDMLEIDANMATLKRLLPVPSLGELATNATPAQAVASLNAAVQALIPSA